MSESDSPHIFRPIPRRPFNLNLTSPTPPDEDSRPSSPVLDPQTTRLLNAAFAERQPLSRAQSIMNLTSSTLFGIFSPTIEGKDRYFAPGDEPDTPWGTGAQTPVKRPSIDDGTYELMRDRSTHTRIRRVQSTIPLPPHNPPVSKTGLVLALGGRAAVLFLLGMGYGALVTRLRTDRTDSFAGAAAAAFSSMEDIIRPSYPGHNWGYMVFWGAAGVALGALLPWFDRVWEDTFGEKNKIEEAEEPTERDAASCAATKETRSGTDWALVVRGVGAFMGIVFAIRKLPWASTLQVSLTLALVNPFLWYLIDRSRPGFLLSAVVGLAGSAVLLGINPDIMPTPHWTSPRNESLAFGGPSGSYARQQQPQHLLGGLATQETLESGIWMISVLFCSCVCFGNIGRRLALNSSAATRGRWGGSR